MKRRFHAVLLGAAGVAILAGCASDDYYGSPGPVSTHTAFYYGSAWYDDPYYYYDDPDYVVTPPDRPDRPALGPRPEQPIAGVPPGGGVAPTPLPADRPVQGARPEPQSRSRMPAAQPRTSTMRSRPSIPSMPRGGGFRGGGRRR